MITIVIPESTWFDEKKSEVLNIKRTTLNLEYSLIAVSLWEMHYKKPFLSTKDKIKNVEEWLYFFYCMTINNKNIDPRIFYSIPVQEFNRVQKYMEDPMTATTITNHETKSQTKQMTNEEIYCAMAMLHIPFECQKWHLNRLIKLIEVCAIRNSPNEKMSKKETAASWRKANAAAKAKYHSRG